ncbi:MAG: alpha/beta hydrolase [Rhodospirillales bacterium]
MSLEAWTWLAWVALGGALAYGLLALALFLFQRRLIYATGRKPAEPQPLDGRLPEVLSAEAADGSRCSHWLWTPRDPEKPLLVLLQGNAGNIGHRIDCYGFLVEDGYGLLLVGYRGYGGNPGKPEEAGIIADARAALAALRQRLPRARVVLFGESLGAAVAIALAAEGETAPLFLLGPFDRLVSSAKARYPWMVVEPLLKETWDSLARIDKVRQPLFWLHGAEDRVTPSRFGRRLFEAAPGPKTELVVPDGGHLGHLDDPEVRARFYDWLARQTAPAV